MTAKNNPISFYPNDKSKMKRLHRTEFFRKKRGCLKSIETRHSEFISESHHTENKSLWEPETSSG
jgi:hypothetical protein